MFAGAAREAVFSNPAVIRRIQADFVPVALKAGLVNNPGGDEESRLYREIGRSKPAPQGICVANSAGKVLDWALSFDNDESVLAFLNHSLKRFREHPDARQLVAAERFMRFPSQKLPDIADNGEAAPVAEFHPKGVRCPAKPGLPPGTVVARLFGRALDAKGQPISDTVSQENYVEDRFTAMPAMQESLSKALVEAGAHRIRIPDEFARLCVTYAYLGQLDVRPCANPLGATSDLKQCEFWAQRVGEGSSPMLLRVEGRSDVVGEADRLHGKTYRHRVTLTWEGFLEMDGPKLTRLLLSAHGTESLKWREEHALAEAADPKNQVAFLPAGRPLDLAREVRYGILGEPVAADEVGAAAAPAQSPAGGPSDMARHLMGVLGPPFAVFLPVVQDDLKVSAEQKQKLQQAMMGAAQGFQQFVQQIEGLPQPEREKKHQEFRQEAHKVFSAFLAEVLNADQQKRLRQIVLQQEGLFALGNPEVAGELKLSDEQKRQFAAIIQETQKRFEALQQKAQASGNPEEVQKGAARIRKEQEAKVEALLTDAQKRQWKAMLGKPLKLESNASA